MIESAGLLVYRKRGDVIEVLLTHPGGPIWGSRDVWSIPKGELDPGESRTSAAAREFAEEVGSQPPAEPWTELGSAEQGKPARKINYVWTVEGDIDLGSFSSNTFTMEWPPKSGRMQEFPENDKAAYMDLGQAVSKIFPAQIIFLERLAAHLGITLPQPPKQQSLL